MSSHLSKLSIQRLSAYGSSKGCCSPLLTDFVCSSVVRCGVREKFDQHVKTEITKLIHSSSVPGAALYFGVAAGRVCTSQAWLVPESPLIHQFGQRRAFTTISDLDETDNDMISKSLLSKHVPTCASVLILLQ